MLAAVLLAIGSSIAAPASSAGSDARKEAAPEAPAEPDAPTAAPREPPRLADVLPEAERNAELAREAWEQGKRAYGDGRLEDAIRFFEQTYRYSGSAGPLFSLGQAHRHAYELSDPGSLEAENHRILAARSFRKYLELEPDGKRSVEAERHLTDLGELSMLDLEGIDPARISVASGIADARVSIDGAESRPLPLSAEVEPGEHEVSVTATGFHPWKRTVHVAEAATINVDADLRPLDAALTVDAMPGAILYVDGRRITRLPATAPVSIAPGRHQIGVARSGRTLFIREVELDNGESRHVDAPLEVTGQRRVAFAAIGVGAGAVIAGAVLGGLAGKAQKDARPLAARLDATIGPDDDREVLDQLGATSLSAQEQAELEGLVVRRDRLRTAAFVTGAGGLAAVGVGLVLLFTDKPPVASQLHELPSRRVTVSPSLRGVSVEARF